MAEQISFRFLVWIVVVVGGGFAVSIIAAAAAAIILVVSPATILATVSTVMAISIIWMMMPMIS